MRFFLLAVVLFSSLTSFADIDLVQFENDLNGKGVVGEVHGAVLERSLFVLSYRNPENFFDHREFPLTTKSSAVLKELKKLHRHDQVKVKGRFIPNSAPIKHIDIEELSVVSTFQPEVSAAPYQYKVKLPQDLVNGSELVGKVHAIADSGKILVIEYKDGVVPVYVADPKYTKDLFRNDKIKMRYTLRNYPNQPTHVSLDTSAPNPLVVTDSMVKAHLKEGSIEGYLILFPKSPQVKFNVFAVQHVDSNGVKREYTLVNFDDPKVFEKIRLRLQEWWDTHPGKIENARNKFINLNVRLRATGKFNVVDPGQANPQILLDGPESLALIQ